MKKVILLGILITGLGLTSMSSYAGGDKKTNAKKSCAKACCMDKKTSTETSEGTNKKACCVKPKS